MENTVAFNPDLKSIPGAYFLVRDKSSNKILRIEAVTIEQNESTAYMAQQPVYYPPLDESFENFKDHVIHNHMDHRGLPQVKIQRFDLERIIEIDTLEQRNFVCNVYIPYLLKKGILPITDIDVSESISAQRVLPGLSIEVSHHEGYPVYVSLETPNACIKAGAEMRKINKPENLFYYYDKEKPESTSQQVFDKLYFNAVVSDVEFPKLSLAIDVSKLNNWNKKSLKNFLTEYLQALGLSQGPYIAFLDMDSKCLSVHVSNITWFNDVPLQVLSDLNPYQLEELYISLRHKYELDIPSNATKPSLENLKELRKPISDYLASVEHYRPDKKNKSLHK